MRKISLIILLDILILILLFCSIAKAGELKHIIRDGEYWYEGIFEERASCVEEEHLWVNLSLEDWCKIGNYDYDKIYKRHLHFSAQICIKCRLISVNYNGNDWYRYELKIKESLLLPDNYEVESPYVRGLKNNLTIK